MARHLRLHLRFPLSVGNVDRFVSKLSSVYQLLVQQHDIGIDFTVASSAAVDDAFLGPIDVVSCTARPSGEAIALFHALAPPGMGDDDVAVLFPVSLKPDPLTAVKPSGCSQCPP